MRSRAPAYFVLALTVALAAFARATVWAEDMSLHEEASKTPQIQAAASPVSEASPAPSLPRTKIRVVEPVESIGFDLTLLPIAVEPKPRAAQLADFDHDRRGDLVYILKNQLHLVTGLLDTSRIERAPVALPFEPAQMAVGDLDRDGNEDVLLLDKGSKALWCAWMNGPDVGTLEKCAVFESSPKELYFVPATAAHSAIVGVLLHPTSRSSRVTVAVPSGRKLDLQVGPELPGTLLTGLRMGDLSGTGRVDAVAFSPISRTIMLSVGADDRAAFRPWIPRHWFWETQFSEEIWAQSRVGVFSTDGMVSILHQVGANGTWRVGRFGDNRGFRTAERMAIPPYVEVHDQLIGDFDGDGIDDIVIRGKKGRNWFLTLSSLLDNSVAEAPSKGWGDRDCSGVGTGDLDGDGLADLLGICRGDGDVSTLGWGKLQAVRAVPGATVKVNGASFTADDEGEVIVDGPAEVRPELPPGVYFPTVRTVKDHSIGTLLRQPPGTRVGPLGPKAPRAFVPSVCVAFNPENSRPWGELIEPCSEGYGVMAVDDPARAASTAAALMRVLCCPLPNPDMLTNEHVEVEEQCPEDFIVTGGTPPSGCETCAKKFRCTKINTKRYQLGAPKAAGYWGSGMSMFEQGNKLNKAAIPTALRFGVGRTGESSWDDDGCISDQWGSVLVSKSRSQCSSYLFRRFEYTGSVTGDPAPGTPVKVLPDCTSISSPFDRYPRCLPN